MRTTTIAALLVTLAACGGDGGLSLTEPHSIEACDLAAPGFGFVGQWSVDEWGCIGRTAPGGATNCDPASLPWSDGVALSIAAVDADMFTVTIDGGMMTDDANGSELSGPINASTSMIFAGCADGSAFVIANDTATMDSFGAFAHRR